MADIFVVMDSVQFQKNGVQNRNMIRNAESEFWLTIPVSGNLKDTIREKKISSDRWRTKHWKSIQSSYNKAIMWETYKSELELLYSREYSTLHEVNDTFFKYFMTKLGLNAKVFYLSELDVSGTKSELVLEICRVFQAGTYISGTGSKGYLDEKSFAESGIVIDYLESISPVYMQPYKEFIEGLSMLDMLLNSEMDKIHEYLYESKIR